MSEIIIPGQPFMSQARKLEFLARALQFERDRCDRLKAMVSVTNGIVFRMIERFGNQQFKVMDIALVKKGFVVKEEGETITVSIAKEAYNAAQEGSKPENDQQEHQGNGEGSASPEDGHDEGRGQGAPDGCGGGDANGKGSGPKPIHEAQGVASLSKQFAEDHGGSR